jgi:hypothetical protein
MHERGGSSFDWESKSESMQLVFRLVSKSDMHSMADHQARVHMGDWKFFASDSDRISSLYIGDI